MWKKAEKWLKSLQMGSHDLDDFKSFPSSCVLDESSLSIERV